MSEVSKKLLSPKAGVIIRTRRRAPRMDYDTNFLNMKFLVFGIA